MGFKEAFFTFDGRLKRLEYFGWGLANFAIMVVGLGIAFALGSSGDGGAIAVAVLFGLAVFATTTVASFAIGIKRLHDMGMVGSHMIWIWLLGVASSTLTATAPGLALVCSLASLGVALWLLFAPSVGDNQYGPKR